METELVDTHTASPEDHQGNNSDHQGSKEQIIGQPEFYVIIK